MLRQHVWTLCLFIGLSRWVYADSDVENWNVHLQGTYVQQRHGHFNSPYQGTNSLDGAAANQSTSDITVFAGARLWHGGEFYVNEELDQGFGLSNTLGVAGFTSGEAYKVGAAKRYYRMPRVFLRQVFSLSDARQSVDGAANQLAGAQTADNVTVTLGKFSVVDVFDNNRYAHDPRGDFLNWAVLDAGAFDYAADAWGYTYGGAAEWTQAWWTLRGGVFNLSKVPNSADLESDFSQFALMVEGEERHQWWSHVGKLKLLGFDNRGRFGKYDDALRLGQATASTPDTGQVRRFASRPGFAINLEQECSTNLGIFARFSANDGSKEAYDFTDIDRSLSFGASLKGGAWQRADDTVGLAFVVNQLSDAARDYFATGGIGILVGDGRLNYGAEQIVESYYSLQPLPHLHLALDYQFVRNPGYNRDRGPVTVLGLRVHAEY